MTSNISFQGINEFFPVAGQDNDTQGFRDNFDTIKQGLRIANEEVSNLQANTARTDQDTDYNLFKIKNAVLENVRAQKLVGFEGNNVNVSPTSIDFSLGSYHLYKVGSGTVLDPFVFDFVNFPGDPVLFGGSEVGVGSVILELYSDGQDRTVAFRPSGNTIVKKNNFPVMPEGALGDIIVRSAVNPVFIEVWRHSATVIYIKYLGYSDPNNTESFASGGGGSGLQGTQGAQGTQGFGRFGPQGIQGVQGPQGIQGVQGPQGTQGLHGAFAGQGVQGPQGTQGLPGAFAGQGIQGVQGPKGETGDVNPQMPVILAATESARDAAIDAKTSAVTAATDASASQTAAAASASNAATSASNAATSASTATTKATQAGIATTKAEQAATSASDLAAAAEISVAAALTHAQTAAAARLESEQFKDEAEVAKVAAEAAATSAQNSESVISNLLAGPETTELLALADEIQTVSTNIESVNTVSTNIDSVNTVARGVIPVRTVTGSGLTIIIDADTTDILNHTVSDSSSILVVSAPSGTPYNFQRIVLFVQTTNQQTYNWNSVFSGSTDLPLPVATTAGKAEYLTFVYSSDTSKWNLLAKLSGF